MARYGLVVRGGRVVDPGRGVDGVADVAFADGKVAAVGGSLEGDSVLDACGCVVMPGMIDFHAHVYWGGASLGIDADALARRAGTTTWLDVGTAGPGNFPGFLRHVIERSQTRILAYLHISFAGIYGFSREVMVGESWELRLLEPKVCAEVARAHPEVIRGIKVRIGANTSGPHGVLPLHLAIEAAEAAGLPIMCHIDRPPPRYEEVLATLRPGDTLTHCFRPFPNAPIHADGRVREACFQARERGILFDIGHGMGSFAFKTARAMLANGFYPDTISSDIHALNVDGPVFDQVTTLSKFLCMGVPLPDVIACTTVNAAMALKRPELGSFRPGSAGDATILSVREGEFDYVDVLGEHMTGTKKIVSEGVVIAGKWWHPQDAGAFQKPGRAA